MGRLGTYASFVKIEHTIFSLPLIYAGTLLYTHTWPGWRVLILVTLAAIGGRVVAMGLNRLIDHAIDARNPRTKGRELPRGAMRRSEAWVLVGLGSLVYCASAWAIDPFCLALTPIPVALFVLYPYLKRFTVLAHLGLGLAWSMGPLAGWVAASRSFADVGEIGWLWLFSLLWVAGFDIIYATMDAAFDREAGLHSLPASLGKRPALGFAGLLHVLAFLCLYLLWRQELGTPLSFIRLISVGALLVWQHLVADKRPEFAFFKLNGILGFLVLGMVLAGI
jgi:4-hydroxybenzoate polyprenyltransferase